MNNSTQIERESQKNLDHLEREIDQQRAKVSNLIDALGNEFSIGNLIERAVGTTKTGGKEFAQNLGHTVQVNPIPSLLTSAGLIWLYVSRNNQPARSGALAGGIRSEDGTFTDMKDRVSGGLEEARDRVSGGIDDAKDRVSGGVDEARDRLQAAGSRASEGLSHAGDALRDQGQRASQKFSQLLEDNPLVLGAAGVALGALLGALVPHSEQEDRLFGDASDDVVDKVKQTAQTTVEQARDSLDPDASAAEPS